MASSSSTDVNSPFHPHPAPPSPDAQPTVVVIVVISFGCLFLFGAILFCVWWFIKRRKEHKERKLVHERKDIDVDEHLKVQEMIMRGPHGPKKVLVSVDDDVRVHEDVHKSEIDMVSKGSHGEGSTSTSSSQHLTLPERQV